MAWHFSSERPVYLQISERIIEFVLTGKYLPGEQIPSVRQLALEAAVNPNTVQRAFSDLENAGIVISRGTVGRYVTDDLAIIENCRNKMAEQTIKKFIRDIEKLSVPKEQIISLIKEEMK